MWHGKLALDDIPGRRVVPGWRAGAQRSRRTRFATVRRTETEYARALRKIARHVEDIVRGMAPDDGIWTTELLRTLEDMLDQYAVILEPWAATQANRILTEVARRDAVAWAKHGKEIGRLLRREIQTAPIDLAMSRMRDEQIRLITSLPAEASERVHDLTVEGLTSGERWTEIAKEIMRTGEVTRSRANTIARTETGRAATTLTQTRAEHVGSPGYWWRTARDADVRPRHRELEGQFILWRAPPVVTEPGQPEVRAHAGAWVNCRCWPEPVIGEAPAPGEVYRLPRSVTYSASLLPEATAINEAYRVGALTRAAYEAQLRALAGTAFE
jgi:SPP1 gp7 family putative phage head morphogenesis protein